METFHDDSEFSDSGERIDIDRVWDESNEVFQRIFCSWNIGCHM